MTQSCPNLQGVKAMTLGSRLSSQNLPEWMRQDLLYRRSSPRVYICHASYHVLCLGAHVLSPVLEFYFWPVLDFLLSRL